MDSADARAWNVQNHFSVQPISFHPPQEIRYLGGITKSIVRAAEAFQPVDLASQIEQPLRVLHVNPEVPTHLRGVHDVVRRDYNRGHERSLEAGKSESKSARSRKPISRIWQAAKKLPRAGSHNVPTSTSRSAE